VHGPDAKTVCYGRFVLQVTMNVATAPGTGVAKHFADFASAAPITEKEPATMPATVNAATSARELDFCMVDLLWGWG